jgi:hypothetical protein
MKYATELHVKQIEERSASDIKIDKLYPNSEPHKTSFSKTEVRD